MKPNFHIHFVRLSFQEMARSHNDIFLVDAKYNTNASKLSMLDVVGCSSMHRKIPTALNSMTNWSQSSSSAATSFSYLSLGRCSAEGFCGLSRADTYFMNSRTLLNFANSLMCMAH